MHTVYDILHNPMSMPVGQSILRLALAALLGGLIGLERQLKHRAAGLRTNMFICFGAAMYTLLSDQLAAAHGGDHTRIAAQIIPGIGFIGAGSILHARGGLVSGLTTAATLFVVASVGMAVGGGAYWTAVFATVLILVALFLLGRSEEWLNLRIDAMMYEVLGPSGDVVAAEVNQILEPHHALMEDVQIAQAREHVRVQFVLKGTHRQQQAFLRAMRNSPVLTGAIALGAASAE